MIKKTLMILALIIGRLIATPIEIVLDALKQGFFCFINLYITVKFILLEDSADLYWTDKGRKHDRFGL